MASECCTSAHEIPAPGPAGPHRCAGRRDGAWRHYGCLLEKDEHLTDALRALFKLPLQGMQLVFCGGMSLSKAHATIERMSEDADLKVVLGADMARWSRNKVRARLSTLKTSVSRALSEIGLVEDRRTVAIAAGASPLKPVPFVSSHSSQWSIPCALSSMSISSRRMASVSSSGQPCWRSQVRYNPARHSLSSVKRPD